MQDVFELSNFILCLIRLYIITARCVWRRQYNQNKQYKIRRAKSFDMSNDSLLMEYADSQLELSHNKSNENREKSNPKRCYMCMGRRCEAKHQIAVGVGKGVHRKWRKRMHTGKIRPKALELGEVSIQRLAGQLVDQVRHTGRNFVNLAMPLQKHHDAYMVKYDHTLLLGT